MTAAINELLGRNCYVFAVYNIFRLHSNLFRHFFRAGTADDILISPPAYFSHGTSFDAKNQASSLSNDLFRLKRYRALSILPPTTSFVI